MSIVTSAFAILVRVLILACCSDLFAASLLRADAPPIDACCGDGDACTCQSSGEDQADDDGGSSDQCSTTSRAAVCPTDGGGDGANARSDAGMREGKKDDGCSCAGVTPGAVGVTFALWWRRRRSNA